MSSAPIIEEIWYCGCLSTCSALRDTIFSFTAAGDQIFNFFPSWHSDTRNLLYLVRGMLPLWGKWDVCDVEIDSYL